MISPFDMNLNEYLLERRLWVLPGKLQCLRLSQSGNAFRMPEEDSAEEKDARNRSSETM